MMRHIHRRLWAVVAEYDTEPVELLSAAWATIWGVWMTAPWFDFGISSVYGWMASHGSRHHWGAALLAIGLFQLIAVSLGRVGLRKAAAIASMFAWVFLGCMLFFGDSRSVGAPLMLVHASFQFWVTVRR